MREWGRRPAAMAVRRCSTAVELPRKSLKVVGSVAMVFSPLSGVSPLGYL
jgi:hypothetical protein